MFLGVWVLVWGGFRPHGLVQDRACLLSRHAIRVFFFSCVPHPPGLFSSQSFFGPNFNKNYYLLTESEDLTGKSKTKTLPH